jgi:hypothetical protein
MQIEFVSAKALGQQRFATDGVLAVMPFTRPAEARQAAQLLARRAEAPGLILGVYDEDAVNGQGGAGFVAIANAAYRASSSPWFAYVAQDAFAGRGWLRLALAALNRNQGVLAAFNDGKWQGQLASFGLARRDWIDSLYEGDFFFPGYARHYADVELTVLALHQQGLAYDANAVLMEVDWEKDGKAVDAKDRALYLSRASTGFDQRVTDARLLGRFR